MANLPISDSDVAEEGRPMRLISTILGLGYLCLAAGAAAEPITRNQVVAVLPKLEALAEKQIDDGGVPGLAIAVVHQDEVVYLEGFGLREAGKPDKVDADTVFQIASLSKPVSATVVAALVSEGIVDWSSRVADLYPAFALKDPYPTQQLTVRDLFNHRSGLPGNAGDDLEDIGFGRDEVMHRLRLVPPSSSFRAGYAYSNAGLTAGALAAAMPTGKSWEDVAEEKLYKPLGMEQTSSRYADFLARENRSALHIGGVGKWEAKLKRDATAQAPAGGVSASARDLTNWMRLELANGKLDGKQLISEAALAATHVPLMARGNNPVSGGASFYGLGWNVEFGRYGLSWGHAGAFSVGARTQVTLYPEQQLGILVLANAFPTGVPEGLADSFADLVFKGSVEKDWIGDWNNIYGGMFGPAVDAAKKAFGEKPSPATPALPAAAYTGAYANDYVGTATVTAEGDALVLKVGPGGKTVYPMTHFDRDLFLIYPDQEMADMPSPVTFAIGPDGKAASLTIDNLNVNGLGVLVRSE
jgi:CubicO group peptidase (beta-lactamase class C family)